MAAAQQVGGWRDAGCSQLSLAVGCNQHDTECLRVQTAWLVLQLQAVDPTLNLLHHWLQMAGRMVACYLPWLPPFWVAAAWAALACWAATRWAAWATCLHPPPHHASGARHRWALRAWVALLRAPVCGAAAHLHHSCTSSLLSFQPCHAPNLPVRASTAALQIVPPRPAVPPPNEYRAEVTPTTVRCAACSTGFGETAARIGQRPQAQPRGVQAAYRWWVAQRQKANQQMLSAALCWQPPSCPAVSSHGCACSFALLAAPAGTTWAACRPAPGMRRGRGAWSTCAT